MLASAHSSSGIPTKEHLFSNMCDPGYAMDAGTPIKTHSDGNTLRADCMFHCLDWSNCVALNIDGDNCYLFDHISPHCTQQPGVVTYITVRAMMCLLFLMGLSF